MGIVTTELDALKQKAFAALDIAVVAAHEHQRAELEAFAAAHAEKQEGARSVGVIVADLPDDHPALAPPSEPSDAHYASEDAYRTRLTAEFDRIEQGDADSVDHAFALRTIREWFDPAPEAIFGGLDGLLIRLSTEVK